MAFSSAAMNWDDMFDATPNEGQEDFTASESAAQKFTKTEEEINKDCVDESLDELGKLKYIIKSGNLGQKGFILDNLARLLPKYTQLIWEEALPKLLEAVAVENSIFKIRVGRTLVLTLQTMPNLLPDQKTAARIFDTARKMIETRDEGVSMTWKALLLELLPLIPLDTCRAFFKEQVTESSLKSSVSARLWIAQCLGYLAPRVDEDTFKTVLMKKLKTFAQDLDSEVRGYMCITLRKIIETSKPVYLPELLDEMLELLVDDEESVQELAFENFLEVMTLFDDNLLTKKIYPTLSEIYVQCKFPNRGFVYKGIGKAIWNLKGKITPEQTESLVTCFSQAVDNQELEVKKALAYNLPAMVEIVGPSQYKSLKVHAALEKLVADDHAEVRRIVASGFHEVVTSLKHNGELVLRDYTDLLSDDNTSVLMALVPNIYTLNTAFVRLVGEDERKQIMSKCLAAERKLADKPEHWREHQTFITHLKDFHSHFGYEAVNSQLVPRLILLLKENRMVPTKEDVIKLLCVSLRYCGRADARDQIIRKILEFRKSMNYQHRLLFLKICERVLVTFSRRFFKEYFITDYLEMAKDSVSNVRLKFSTMVPKVRSTLNIPKDISLLHKLTDIIGNLMTGETSPDIVQNAKQCLKYMKVESELDRDDKDDKAKEEEEQKLAEIAKQNEAKDLDPKNLFGAKGVSKTGANSSTTGGLSSSQSTSLNASSKDKDAALKKTVVKKATDVSSVTAAATIRKADTSLGASTPPEDKKKTTVTATATASSSSVLKTKLDDKSKVTVISSSKSISGSSSAASSVASSKSSLASTASTTTVKAAAVKVSAAPKTVTAAAPASSINKKAAGSSK